MTINVALQTSETIVLGCDSLSSVMSEVVHAQPGNVAMLNGQPVVDDNGNLCFTSAATTYTATNVFGGVRKMFCIYKSDTFEVAAVTAGLAILDQMTIAEHASKFLRECKETYNSVVQVAGAFQSYIRNAWEVTVNYQPAPGTQFQPQYPNVEFLIAGFEPSGPGRVYRVDIASGNMIIQNDGAAGGIAWAGQANFVQRLILGADEWVLNHLGHQFGQGPEEMRNIIAPCQSLIDFANLPTQYAIDLVELLVNLQSGMQRFEPGIATVGGRTHIGVLRRGEEFTMLNEPPLVHKHTGYNHDD